MKYLHGEADRRLPEADRDEHNNLRRMKTAVDDAGANKRRRHDVYLSSAFEREERELFDSLKVFPPRMKDVKDDAEEVVRLSVY